jgi:hypothetical protein
MKLKISAIESNPFKKEINDGKLDENTIEILSHSLKDLGLMNSIPVRKNKDGKYEMVCGHHRVEAVKRNFGEDFEIETTLHNYSDEQMLRGMVLENITQRTDDFREVAENLIAIRNFLKSNFVTPGNEIKKTEDNPKGAGRINESGSYRDVAKWLNENGEIMSIKKICVYLDIKENLSEDLYNKVTNKRDLDDDDAISISDAKSLAMLSEEYQEPIAEQINDMKKREVTRDDRKKYVAKFNDEDTPKEIKDKIISKEIALDDIENAINIYETDAIENAKSNRDVEYVPNFHGQLVEIYGYIMDAGMSIEQVRRFLLDDKVKSYLQNYKKKKELTIYIGEIKKKMLKESENLQKICDIISDSKRVELIE